MPVGFLLQSLLKSLSRPFAAFGHHFLLNLSQGPGSRRFHFHPLPLVVFGFVRRLRNLLPTHYGGIVKMRPLRAKRP
jgi:hypothetical protein